MCVAMHVFSLHLKVWNGLAWRGAGLCPALSGSAGDCGGTGRDVSGALLWCEALWPTSGVPCGVRCR